MSLPFSSSLLWFFFLYSSPSPYPLFRCPRRPIPRSHLSQKGFISPPSSPISCCPLSPIYPSRVLSLLSLVVRYIYSSISRPFLFRSSTLLLFPLFYLFLLFFCLTPFSSVLSIAVLHFVYFFPFSFLIFLSFLHFFFLLIFPSIPTFVL